MAINQTCLPRLLRRITRTASAIHLRRCGKTWASSSATQSQTRTRWSLARSAGRIAALVSDGAAAVILCANDEAASADKAVTFRAAEQVNDFLPMSARDMLEMEGPALAWARAKEAAGITLEDLSAVETHDCFTTAELLEYEAMGLTPKGKGRIAIDEGWVQKDGKLPINPSGGLKAKGHPIGATGVSMHIVAAMQALGQAGDMQVDGALS